MFARLVQCYRVELIATRALQVNFTRTILDVYLAAFQIVTHVLAQLDAPPVPLLLLYQLANVCVLLDRGFLDLHVLLVLRTVLLVPLLDVRHVYLPICKLLMGLAFVQAAQF